jgi:predicted PurR-regulated permease PerM
VFAGFFGAIGALIGVPIAAAIISIIQTYGKRYELIPELHSIETKS